MGPLKGGPKIVGIPVPCCDLSAAELLHSRNVQEFLSAADRLRRTSQRRKAADLRPSNRGYSTLNFIFIFLFYRRNVPVAADVAEAEGTAGAVEQRPAPRVVPQLCVCVRVCVCVCV